MVEERAGAAGRTVQQYQWSKFLALKESIEEIVLDRGNMWQQAKVTQLNTEFVDREVQKPWRFQWKRAMNVDWSRLTEDSDQIRLYYEDYDGEREGFDVPASLLWEPQETFDRIELEVKSIVDKAEIEQRARERKAQQSQEAKERQLYEQLKAKFEEAG